MPCIRDDTLPGRTPGDGSMLNAARPAGLERMAVTQSHLSMDRVHWTESMHGLPKFGTFSLVDLIHHAQPELGKLYLIAESMLLALSCQLN